MIKPRKVQRVLLFLGALLLVAYPVSMVGAEEITPAEKLRMAEELSNRALGMAVKAKETGNLELLKSALERVNKASLLVLEVVAVAQKKADPNLAQATINAADTIHKAISQIIATCEYLVTTSTDPHVIADAEEIIKKAKETEELNAEAKQIILASLGKPGRAEPQAPQEMVPLTVPPPDTETTELEVYQREASPSQ